MIKKQLLFLPAPRSQERNKPASPVICHDRFSTCDPDFRQILHIITSYRSHDPSSLFHKGEKIFGNIRGCGGNNGSIITVPVRFRVSTVIAYDFNIRYSGFFEVFSRIFGKFGDTFIRPHELCYPCNYGCLVPGPRAQFENQIVILQFEELGHDHNNVRLGDGLAVPDWKRTVFICGPRHIFGDKQVAGDLTHDSQNILI